jgi:Protein of unknown function (DUF5672)
MLRLAEVTLCCVDTRLPQLALEAMQKCMAQVTFGKALLFTCKNHGLKAVPSQIEVIELDHIRSVQDYSHFLLKGLAPHLHTSHMLIVQWDGYVIDPGMWDPAFLSVDYVGPVWPQFHDGHRVGNGGFSLRSRKLLDALASDAFEAQHPEDVCIARTWRTQLEEQFDIRFADEAMAHRFAFERERLQPSSFGFHGLSNLASVMSKPELQSFVDAAPVELFGSVEARGFIKRLVALKLKQAARTALQKRRAAKPINLADLRLWLRHYLA